MFFSGGLALPLFLCANARPVITALFDILINPALQQEFFCYNVIGRYVPITLKENCNVQDFKYKSGFDIDKGRRF